MEFSRQEYRSGLPFPSPGGLPDPEIEPGFPATQANSLPSEPPVKPVGIIIYILMVRKLRFKVDGLMDVPEATGLHGIEVL